jgi:hypothetical protein
MSTNLILDDPLNRELVKVIQTTSENWGNFDALGGSVILEDVITLLVAAGILGTAS